MPRGAEADCRAVGPAWATVGISKPHAPLNSWSQGRAQGSSEPGGTFRLHLAQAWQATAGCCTCRLLQSPTALSWIPPTTSQALVHLCALIDEPALSFFGLPALHKGPWVIDDQDPTAFKGPESWTSLESSTKRFLMFDPSQRRVLHITVNMIVINMPPKSGG